MGNNRGFRDIFDVEKVSPARTLNIQGFDICSECESQRKKQRKKKHHRYPYDRTNSFSVFRFYFFFLSPRKSREIDNPAVGMMPRKLQRR